MFNSGMLKQLPKFVLITWVLWAFNGKFYLLNLFTHAQKKIYSCKTFLHMWTFHKFRISLVLIRSHKSEASWTACKISDLIVSILAITNFKHSLHVSVVGPGLAETVNFSSAFLVLNKTLELWNVFGNNVGKVFCHCYFYRT